MFKFLKTFGVRSPVIEIVKEIIADPSKHTLKLAGDDMIIIYFRKDTEWRISIANHVLWMWNSDTIEWMNTFELRYIYRHIRPLLNEPRFSRKGWVEKIQ